jgi:RNA-directed DNA polymerase
MSDKRQKNQLQMVLAFTEEGRSEAPKARREGTESLTAKRACESPAIPEQVMEEVCERENCWRALKRVKANKGSPGIDGMKGRRAAGLPEAALASDSGTTVEWDLQAATGEAGGNPEAGRRSAQAGHPDGAGSIYPAGGDAGSAKQMGPDVFRTQHGFRPKRSAHQAVAKAQQYIAAGHRWVVDLDLEKFFDRVNHDKLMAAIARRVSDKRMLKLIRAFLKSG